MAERQGNNMAISPMSDDLNIIAALADKPNATDGLSAAQLKAKFDQGPGLIKTYINATLVPAIDADQLGPITRQAVINGGFSVNQRVKSGTVTLAAGAYGHDRWKAGASGCTYTFATVANVTTITITAGTLIQAIEGINLYSGSYTLSWTGTAQGKIGAGSYSASGVTGTVVGGTDTNIEFNTGTLSKVQFNIGSLALPFQPRSFAEELAVCQRYYERHDSLIGGRVQLGLATVITATSLAIPIAFKTQKRGSYTMTSGGGWRILPGGTVVTLVMGEWSLSNTVINMTVSGFTVGQSFLVQSSDSGGWVAWDAEI
jgi:hypothetical protein